MKGLFSGRKLMGTKSFRTFTVAEIITKTWMVHSKVKIEKVEENVFSFTFSSKADCKPPLNCMQQHIQRETIVFGWCTFDI